MGWGLEASGGRKEQWSGVKLHNPSLGGPGSHTGLPALSKLSRERSLYLTPTPRSCRRPQAARQEQGTLFCPLPPPVVPCVPTGWPYLSGGGSCHLGDLRELWQAGWRRATFVPSPPPPQELPSPYKGRQGPRERERGWVRG